MMNSTTGPPTVTRFLTTYQYLGACSIGIQWLQMNMGGFDPDKDLAGNPIVNRNYHLCLMTLAWLIFGTEGGVGELREYPANALSSATCVPRLAVQLSSPCRVDSVALHLHDGNSDILCFVDQVEVLTCLLSPRLHA